MEYLYIEFVKVDPHKRKYVVLKIVCGPSKQTLPQLFYNNLVCVSIARIQRLENKVLNRLTGYEEKESTFFGESEKLEKNKEKFSVKNLWSEKV